jgi:hypothetical protein
MKKLKSISATEALRLMRLGFSDQEIIQADQEVSGSFDLKVESPKKKERREKPKIESVPEDLATNEILKKLDEIKKKHEKAMEMAKDFAFQNKKNSEKNKNIFENIKETTKKETEKNSGPEKNEPEENGILGYDLQEDVF